MEEQPFKNLKIVELTSVLAGPAVGMFFAELGAEVIKIENIKTGGDVTRNWKLPTESKDGLSAYYKSVNWGKTSLLMDLTNIHDRAEVLELIESADIVIANYKKGSAAKLGLDYDTLRQLNPKLIYANLTAFGENEEGVGFDVLLQAETGFMFMTGEPGRPSVKMPVALIDLLAAHQMKEALLVALLERERLGCGSFISVSLAQSAIASLANQASNYLNESFIPQKMGAQHPNIAPYGDIFTTKDQQDIILAVGTEKHFALLCTILDIPELNSDERFTTNAQRVINRKALIQLLQDAIQKYDRSTLLEALQEQKVPAGVIKNMKEVFEAAYAREMVLTNAQGHKCVKTVAFDIKLSDL